MPAWLPLVLALAVGGLVGAVIGAWSVRRRARRLADGLEELARGNLAHRVLLPGDDALAHGAQALNRFAEDVQCERERTSERDEARRRLLANISHDLRTPITSIAGYVDALQRGLGRHPERYLAIIAEKADELTQLTDDLFYATRLDAGDLQLKSLRLDLAEAVRRCVLSFEPQLSSKGARVDVVVPDLPCTVTGDPSAFSRILANLVSNAVRHGDGMTVFGVALVDGQDEYLVRISNDGARLPDDTERLFQRGVAGTTGGAGLGLSIARELAQRMGGTVSAENRLGGGVRFTLAVPKPLPDAAVG